MENIWKQLVFEKTIFWDHEMMILHFMGFSSMVVFGLARAFLYKFIDSRTLC